MRALVWLGDSLEQVRRFPDDVRRLVGYQLYRVQSGMEPMDWKPMPSVGVGVNELRIRAGGAFRVMYVAKFAEAVYVVHAFEKKSRKTPRQDLETAKRRFRAVLAEKRYG